MWLISNRNVFLTALEAGSQTRALSWSDGGETLFQVADLLLYLHMVENRGESSMDFFYADTNHIHKGSLLMTSQR